MMERAIDDTSGEMDARTVDGATPSGSGLFCDGIPWVGTHGYSCSSASRMVDDQHAARGAIGIVLVGAEVQG